MSSKRARADNDEAFGTMRMQPGESFKTKLSSMASSGSWIGFGTGNEKLKIAEGDITVSEGPHGLVMKLSNELKNQLHKPWAKALILKNMGRPHMLNFMLP
ncbi:hypothetical protein ACOSQ3_019090 [Xanthoceras sorbifolium]